jgi:hypothetical protein
LSRLGFYQWGYHSCCCELVRKKTYRERHILIRDVIGVMKMSRHSLTRNVGHGSNIQYLQGDALITIVSSLETGKNSQNNLSAGRGWAVETEE